MSESARLLLDRALIAREREVYAAISRLVEIAPCEHEDEVYLLRSQLRDAPTLIGCLRRLAQGRSAEELHAAFGAPGDFGYETPLGDALYRIYSEPRPRPENGAAT